MTRGRTVHPIYVPPPVPAQVSKSFDRAVEAVGLNNGIIDKRMRAVFHTLRHTYASCLVEAGVDLYTVKELMGHSSLTMTERYSHVVRE